MKKLTQHYTAIAFRKLMKPIIRLVIRNGFMYREFTNLCKSLYVEVATEDYGVGGRPTNISKVAMLTGLDRKEVKRQRDQLADYDGDQDHHHNSDRISRILSGWYQDKNFIIAPQRPKDLPLKGANSFASLVKEYGSDVPVSTLLKELIRAGAVEELVDDKTKDKNLRVLTQHYIPTSQDLGALDRACRVITDVTSTLQHNLYRSDKDLPSRFERCATNLKMDEKTVPTFRRFIDKTGQRFLEDVDAWMTAHETHHSEESQTIRLGIGAYWIEDDQPDRDSL